MEAQLWNKVRKEEALYRKLIIEGQLKPKNQSVRLNYEIK